MSPFTSRLFWKKHKKINLLFSNVVLFELHTLVPTFLQCFDNFLVIGFTDVRKKAFICPWFHRFIQISLHSAISSSLETVIMFHNTRFTQLQVSDDVIKGCTPRVKNISYNKICLSFTWVRENTTPIWIIYFSQDCNFKYGLRSVRCWLSTPCSGIQ